MTSSPKSAARRNEKLWIAIRETGLSYAAFALEVRTTAEASGRHDLRPDRTRVGHWVNDGQVPQHPMPDILAQTLSRLRGFVVEPEDLGLPRAPAPVTARPRGAADVAHSFARHVTSSDLSVDDISELDIAVRELRAVYPERSPSDLWPLAMEHRQRAHELLHHRRHTLREGRELAYQAGMLSVILAWIAHDIADHEAVAAFAADAGAHGQQADAPEVTAWAEDVLATDALFDNRPLDALTAATRGLAVAPRKSDSAVRLAAQLGRIYARLGNHAGFDEAAARVEAFRPNLSVCRSGLFRFDGAGIDSFNASAYLWLGRPHEAHDVAVASIRQYRSMPPAGAPTRLAIAQLDLALAHAALGNPEEAVRVGHAALSSGRLVHAIATRARHLDLDLRRRYPGLRGADDLREQVRAIQPVA